MGAIWFLILLTAFFFIISVVFFMGKGRWLIAGYNTASRKEKDRYDEKKLCRSMGVFCIYAGLIMAVLTFRCFQVEIGTLPESELASTALYVSAGMIAGVAAEMIYSNKMCKK